MDDATLILLMLIFIGLGWTAWFFHLPHWLGHRLKLGKLSYEEYRHVVTAGGRPKDLLDSLGTARSLGLEDVTLTDLLDVQTAQGSARPFVVSLGALRQEGFPNISTADARKLFHLFGPSFRALVKRTRQWESLATGTVRVAARDRRYVEAGCDITFRIDYARLAGNSHFTSDDMLRTVAIRVIRNTLANEETGNGLTDRQDILAAAIATGLAEAGGVEVREVKFRTLRDTGETRDRRKLNEDVEEELVEASERMDDDVKRLENIARRAAKLRKKRT